MKMRDLLSSPKPYIAWLIASGLLLPVSFYLHPYIFLYTALCTTAISALAVALALFGGWRSALWALLASTPTLIAAEYISSSPHGWV
jgi:hypothetical protein